MATGRPDTLLLPRRDVADLLGMDDCITAVEKAFRLAGESKAPPPGVLSLPAPQGGFHVKAAGLGLPAGYVAVKINGNFPQNRERFGLPTIQGVVVLADARAGTPLAIMDSGEITRLRTAAATAVAARYLARGSASVATVCGCGVQGRAQLAALARVRRLRRAYAFDIDPGQARRYAEELSAELGLEIEAVAAPAPAVGRSDICVTCTPSRRYFLRREDIAPGTFIAAVGADSPEKQEIDPALLAAHTVVVDVREQCAAIGELHHALEAGLVASGSVAVELGEVIAGRKPGRTSDGETIIFDSTGTAWQYVAAAAAVYEAAIYAGRGVPFDFAG